MIYRVIISIFVGIIVGLVAFGLYRTYKVEHSDNQAIFLKGSLPSNLDGFYKGTVNSYHGTWQGKTFFASQSKGINSFKDAGKDTTRYPFKTYSGTGLLDGIQVLKIDYNVPENKFWTRFLLDEIVQTEPNNYVGKIHLRIIPGLPFTIGYFRLSK